MGWIVFLLGLGLLLVLMELFITPGLIVGVIGIMCWGAAIWQVYELYGVTAGNWSTVGMVALLALMIFWGLKTNLWNKVTVHTNITGRTNETEGFDPQIGMHGRTLSTLRPMGSARFGDVVVEVTTRGDMIEQNADIEIIEISHGKIYVK
ncbi:MAG: NfeD family protein [Chitinophagales bacterium]|nr:NfeD family protein [Chitinophagales bacterium]MCO5254161.1 hypothetical protein [Bacteroidota bacterium]